MHKKMIKAGVLLLAMAMAALVGVWIALPGVDKPEPRPQQSMQQGGQPTGDLPLQRQSFYVDSDEKVN